MPTALFVKATNNTIPAGAIYAAPNGVPGNAGTAASPKDLQSAYAATPANGTLVLTGTLSTPYRTSLTVSKKVNIIAKPGDSPVLSGASVIPSNQFVLETGDIYYKDNYVPSYGSVKAEYASPEVPQAANCQQVFVDDVYYKQVSTKAALVANSFFVTTNRLYIKGNPTGKVVEVSTRANGIVITAAATRVSGILVTKFGQLGIHIKNTAVVHKVTSFYNGFRNLFVENGENIELLDVGAYYGGSAGIHVNPTTLNFKMLGGELVGNNIADFANYWTASGIKMAGHFEGYPFVVNGTRTIEGVYIEGSSGANHHGIWLDNNCTNVRMVGNTVTKCLAGIHSECSFSNYIVNNLCISNSYGILISNSKGDTVANNTTVLNSKNIVVKGTGRVNPDAAQRAAGYTWTTENVKVYNNVLDRSSGSVLLLETKTQFPGTRAISEMHHNAYNRESATKPANILNWKNAAGTYDSYDSLTEFRADYPSYEEGSIGRTAQTTATSHPFYNAGTLVLKTGSPLINAGSLVSGVVANILNVPENTRVNIGSSITSTNTSLAPEPTSPCAAEVEEAVAPLRERVNELNDDLFAANGRIAQLEGSTSPNQDALIAQLTAERDAAITENTNLSNKVAGVKLQLTETLAYLG